MQLGRLELGSSPGGGSDGLGWKLEIVSGFMLGRNGSDFGPSLDLGAGRT